MISSTNESKLYSKFKGINPPKFLFAVVFIEVKVCPLLSLNLFNNNKDIDISKIECDKYKNKLILINCYNKNYIYNQHNEILINYCEYCKIDLFLLCKNEYKYHILIPYKGNLIDIKNIRKK